MDRDGGPRWLSAACFAFLSFNCGMAIYRSSSDPGSVAFVVVAYLALLLLFRCLRLLERPPAAQPLGQQHLKAAVWALSTLLTVMFSFKVAAIMPWWCAVVVWAMAAATVIGGFVAFFVHREAA